MAAPPERIRPSATVILTRRAPRLEVFLVERSQSTRFFPGYHAFPGGVVDPEDGTDALARRRAAARELREETGVRVDDLDLLVEAGTLVTPPFGPTRYDTTFFVCELPAGQEPRVEPGELAGGAWMRPAEALRRWEEAAFPIPPPTLAYLQLLAAHEDPARAAQAARAMDGRPHHERFRIELHPGVYVLPLRTRTLPPATTTNCYLFDSDPIVVVDPGPSAEEDLVPLHHTLAEMARDGREVVVVLTHHHADHVGGAASLRKRHRARVLAHPRTGTLLPPGVVDDVLQDGDAIDLGAWGARPWRLTALATPGHAPGHLALRDDRWGAIVAGDLVSGVSTILVDPDEGDMGQYMAALARCAALAPPVVLPGHGPVLPGGAFAAALEHRRMRERKVLAALGPEARAADALLPAVYDDTPRELWGLAARSLESHLRDLERRGLARRAGDAWARA